MSLSDHLRNSDLSVPSCSKLLTAFISEIGLRPRGKLGVEPLDSKIANRSSILFAQSEIDLRELLRHPVDLF